MSLKGKTAIVTGSTSGIGLGIAQALAAAGADILLNGFGEPDVIRHLTADLAKRHEVHTAYHGADVSRAQEVEAMIDHALTTFGRIDILVNNAGIQHVDPLDTFPLEKWDQVLATNLSSVFYTIRSALPIMRKQGWGRIVNIASAHGLVASPNKSAYIAAKHGMVGLTKVTALETAGSGITANALCPGWVLTPLVQKQIDAIAARKNIPTSQAELELLSEKQPSKQFVTTEQVGAYAVFLCSDAAAQITGAALSIDGGWTAQ